MVAWDCVARAFFLVCSGGGPGIMEAANRGASDAGGCSIGLNIGLPHEQRPNATSRRVWAEFHYFFMRKPGSHTWPRHRRLSGGFGTLDELFRS
jgi:predicted Rossmann-fold nucleotide-binding protein